jgi:hypothetical protein
MGGKGGKHFRRESKKDSPPKAAEFLTSTKRQSVDDMQLPSSGLKDIAESGHATGTSRMRSEKIKDLIARAFAAMHTNESIDLARVIVVYKQVCQLAKTAEVCEVLPKAGRVYFLAFKNLFSEIPCSDRVLEEALQRVDFEKWAKAAPTDEVAPLPLQPVQLPPKTVPRAISNKTRGPQETVSPEEHKLGSFSSVSSILYSDNESKTKDDGEVITEDDFLTSALEELPKPVTPVTPATLATPATPAGAGALRVPGAAGAAFLSPVSPPSPTRSSPPPMSRAPSMNRQPSVVARAAALWSE